MKRKRGKRSVGQRQASWLLNGGAALLRDPSKDKPDLEVIELPDWITEQPAVPIAATDGAIGLQTGRTETA